MKPLLRQGVNAREIFNIFPHLKIDPERCHVSELNEWEKNLRVFTNQEQIYIDKDIEQYLSRIRRDSTERERRFKENQAINRAKELRQKPFDDLIAKAAASFKRRN